MLFGRSKHRIIKNMTWTLLNAQGGGIHLVSIWPNRRDGGSQEIQIVPSSGLEGNKAILSTDPASWAYRKVCATR